MLVIPPFRRVCKQPFLRTGFGEKLKNGIKTGDNALEKT